MCGETEKKPVQQKSWQEHYEERVRAHANKTGGCTQCIDGWVEITPGSKIPCGFCGRA